MEATDRGERDIERAGREATASQKLVEAEPVRLRAQINRTSFNSWKTVVGH